MLADRPAIIDRYRCYYYLGRGYLHDSLGNFICDGYSRELCNMFITFNVTSHL